MSRYMQLFQHLKLQNSGLVRRAASTSNRLLAEKTAPPSGDPKQNWNNEDSRKESGTGGSKNYLLGGGIAAVGLVAGLGAAAHNEDSRNWMAANIFGAKYTLEAAGYCFNQLPLERPAALPSSPVTLAEHGVALLSTDRADVSDQKKAQARAMQALDELNSAKAPNQCLYNGEAPIVYTLSLDELSSPVICQCIDNQLSSYPDIKYISSTSEQAEGISVIAENSAKLLRSGKPPASEAEIAEKIAKEKQKHEKKLRETEKRELEYIQRQKEKGQRQEALELEKQRARDQQEKAQAETLVTKIRRNQELESQCTKTISKVKKMAVGAVAANEDAIKVSKNHLEVLKQAMDAEKEEDSAQIWPHVVELNDTRLAKLEKAHQTQDQVQNEIVDFLKYLSDCKDDADLKDNVNLADYKKQMNEIAYDVKSTADKLRAQETVSSVMKHYYQLLQKDREDFKRELEAIVPQVQVGEKGLDMKEEEMHALLAHAYRRIDQLKKQLYEQKDLEEHRLQTALCQQKLQDQKEANIKISMELDKQYEELQLDKESQLMLQQRNFEAEMKRKLDKQASIHYEYENDMLEVQKKKLEERFDLAIRERLVHERHGFIDEIAKNMAQLKGLEVALEERAYLGQVINEVQDLMSSSMCFMHAVAKDDNCAEDTLVKLDEVMNRCKAASEENPFVQAVINGVPATAYQRGIYPPSTLERRFEKVYSECKKYIADPKAQNFASTAVANLKNKLSWNDKPKYTCVNDFIHTDDMSQQEILVQAKYFMDKKCYSGAVRCMVQLEGKSREVAHDWIVEMRMVLECRQAAETLYAYATSKGMGTIF